jgi:hypothetical protein
MQTGKQKIQQATDKMSTSFKLKIKISGLNKSARYQHWGKLAGLAKTQRTLAAVSTSNQIVSGKISSGGKYIVNLIRSGKRKLDDDNLVGSLKHIRDGIADALGVNDGSNNIKFRYDQKICNEYFLEIYLEEI